MRLSPLAVLSAWLERNLNRQVPAVGLGVFRIGYGLIALQEIAFLYYFRHLIFDETPYLDPGPALIPLFLVLWAAAALGLTLGLNTRLCALVNYLFWVAFTSFTPMWRDFDGGFDQLMTGSGLLLVFLPSWRALSLDNLRLKLKHSRLGQRYEPQRTVSVLAYTLPLFLSLGLLYFDSAIHKLFAPHWRNGMGAWLPSSHPYYISALDMSWLLEQEQLERGIGYTIIVFQFLFPLLFWHRYFRVPFLVLGALFHGGITLSFNIYPFGLGMLVHYALLVPFSWWRKLKDSLRLDSPRLKVFYDGQCPLCWRTVLTLEHLDVRRGVVFLDLQTHASQEAKLAEIEEAKLLKDLYAVDAQGVRYCGLETYLKILETMGYPKPIAWLLRLPGIYPLASRLYRHIADNRQRLSCDASCALQVPPKLSLQDAWEEWLGSPRRRAWRLAKVLLVLVLLQLNSTLHYGLLYRLGLADSLGPLGTASNLLISVSHAFFGITPHPLYLDDHFKGYELIFAITYLDQEGRERWLPFVNEEGRLIAPNWGRVHSMWANIAVSPRLEEWRLRKFLEKVTAFYGQNLGLDLNEARFVLKAKAIRMPADWEPGLRRFNLSQPWRDYGEILWHNKIMQVNFKEKLVSHLQYSAPRQ
jgi:predicted DCC family thiol-disulfide oxidoreductase YuxK